MRKTERLLVTVVLALAGAGSASAQGQLHLWPGGGDWDGIGESVAAADVNADGYADVIIGAPHDIFVPAAAGRVDVRSGVDGGLLYSFNGVHGFDYLGYAVGAGDVDNDGYADVIAAAPREGGVGGKGAVYVYSGSTGATLHSLAATGTDEWFGGGGVASGDVNADGFEDIVAGAPLGDGSFVDAGKVYVMSGQNGSTLYTFVGDGLNEFLGTAVAVGRDVDGDAFADVIAGMPSEFLVGGPGRVRVYAGQTGAMLHEFQGVANGDEFGSAVAAADDVDGDGRSDIVVGAYREDATDIESGAVWVFSGKTGAPIHHLTDPDSDRMGVAVGAGDVDGDGHTDVLVTNILPRYVRVYSGLTGAPIYDLQDPEPVNGFGIAVAAADVNADGFDDPVIGAPGSEIAGTHSGKVLVFSGTCGPIAHYGEPCAGSGGFTPVLSLSGCATPLGTVELIVANGLGDTAFFVMLGVQPGFAPMSGGCALLVSPLIAIVGPLPLPGSGAGQGTLEIGVKLPPVPPLAFVAAQAFVADPGVPWGFAATNGVSFEVH